MIFVFPILPLFWKYHVTVTSDKLDVGYSASLVANAVERSNIDSAEPIAIEPWRQWVFAFDASKANG